MVVTRAGREETVSYWLVGLECQLERCELPGDEWWWCINIFTTRWIYMVLLNYTLRNGQDDKLYVMCTLPHFLNFLINLFYRWTEKRCWGKRGIWYLYNNLSYVLFLNINVCYKCPIKQLLYICTYTKTYRLTVYIIVQIMYNTLYNVTCTNTHYFYRLHYCTGSILYKNGIKFHIHFYLFYLQLNTFKSTEIVLVHYL